MRTLLVILSVLLCTASFAQVVTKVYAANGVGKDTKPNVILKLKNDNSYDLQIFNDNYFTWQFYNGNYSIQKDTLSLEYRQLYVVPTCQLIDTFHRERTVNFLYVDADDKVIDTFSIEFAGDTINIDHFPLSYQAKENDNTAKSNIKDTWYVPDFQGEMSVRFYKPTRKTKDVLIIPFVMNAGSLMATADYKYLFVPFDILKQQ